MSVSTHHYDGLLRDEMSQTVSTSLEQAVEQTTIVKLQSLASFRSEVVEKKIFTETGQRFYDLIVTDMVGNPQRNYDPSNNLDAGDLLYLCAILLSGQEQNEGLLSILNDQLQEISLGSCPQGRTHRLLQVLYVLSEG